MPSLIASIKLAVVFCVGCLLLGSGALASQDHQHEHSHAPESAKELKNPIKSDEAAISAGRALYTQNCAPCHGPDGKSKTRMAAALEVKPTDLTAEKTRNLKDGEIFWVITNGIEKSGMPDFGPTMSEEERWQTTIYVRELGKGEPK